MIHCEFPSRSNHARLLSFRHSGGVEVRMPNMTSRVVPLHRETLREGVYSRLCELILHGGIVPGESMTVASLAEAFGVSPMPVREALTRLSAAGALTVISGRTVGVPNLTRDRLDDLRRVRREIEPMAADWAAQRATPAFSVDLEDCFSSLLASEAASDGKLYIEANYAFHFCIYRQAESPTMLAIINDLWLQVSPYLHLLRESGNFNLSNRHHKQVFDALVEGSGSRARTAIRNDIDDAYDGLARLL